MEKEKRLSNRQKIEDVLLAIDGHHKPKCTSLETYPNYSVQEISGHIDNVEFNGKWYKRHMQEDRLDPNFVNHAEIDLQANGKKLCKISTKYNFGKGFLFPKARIGLMEPKLDGKNVYLEDRLAPLKKMTEITVTSPKWNQENGVTSVKGIGRKKLKICHAVNETVDAVIDQVYDDVIRSQDKIKEVDELRSIRSVVKPYEMFDSELDANRLFR